MESLHTTYNGTIRTALSTTVSSHSSGTATVTLSSTSAVLPGDFFTVTSTGAQYLINSLNGNACNIGVAITGSLTGLDVTVTRRSMPLATAGRVYQIIAADGAKLNEAQLDAGRAQFEESGGQAVAYRVGYAENLDLTYVNFYPAPVAGGQYFITQARAASEDGDIPMAEPQIAEVLAAAYLLRTLHSPNPALAVFAEKAMSMVKGLRNAVSSTTGVMSRK